MDYRPQGVCSRLIHVDVDNDGIIHNVQFEGGCSGNAQGISRLIEGMEINSAITRMEGIQCGYKETSCPDQLANALKLIKGQQS